MTENKRYYYFQIWQNFLQNRIIKRIKQMQFGSSIILCYQELLLATLNTDGWFYYEEIGNSIEEELSLEVNEPIDTINLTLSTLEHCGLIERASDNNSIRIVIIPDVMRIGSECESAKRMRKSRANKSQRLPIDDETSQCAHIVKNCDTEIEINTDIDTDIDDDISIIIQYYNFIFTSNVKNSLTTNENIKIKIISHGIATIKRVIDQVHTRYITGEMGAMYPSLGFIVGQGWDESLKKSNKNPVIINMDNQQYVQFIAYENEK